MQLRKMKMIGFRALFLGLIFTMVGMSAQAQKIAYVKVNEILESIPDYNAAQAELDKVAKEWRSDISQEYDVIKGMYNRYQAEQVLMSDEARKEAEEAIMEKEKQVRDMQKAKFGPEGELFQRRQELVRPIQDKVYEAIETYANDRGYDFIFDKSGSAGMIFTNEDYDKTQDVIKILN